ncbi:hypothetical protein JD969_07635 [Planctomycetota bacterium]|nr:hypothetical protein JD969_07635 [Planctomycetota bacterium]
MSKDMFSKEDDHLNRGDCATNLTRLIQSQSEIKGEEGDGFVMTVSAPWGFGKTYFIRHIWGPMLLDEGYKCLYYNAWEHDFADDAFLSFIREMGFLIDQLEHKQTSDPIVMRNTRMQTLEAVGKWDVVKNKAADFLTRKGVVQSLTTLAGLALEAKGLQGAGAFSAAIGGATDAATQTVLNPTIGREEIMKQMELDQEQNTRCLIDAFKEAVGEYVEVIGEGKPIVVFIDELDRCKPTFSIELLEAIKHLFAVKNVVFVLGVDRQRLGDAASHLIGFSKDSAEGYLRRFVDIDFHLPEVNSTAIWKYELEKFTADLQQTKAISKNISSYVELAHILQLSVRDQLHCIRQIKLIQSMFLSTYSVKLSITLYLLLLMAYDQKFATKWATEGFKGKCSQTKELFFNFAHKNAVNSNDQHISKLRAACHHINEALKWMLPDDEIPIGNSSATNQVLDYCVFASSIDSSYQNITF